MGVLSSIQSPSHSAISPAGSTTIAVADLHAPPPPTLDPITNTPAINSQGRPRTPRDVATYLSQQKFLAHFAEHLNTRKALAECSGSYIALDRWMQDPEFVRRYTLARRGRVEIAIDDIELVAIRRALAGETSMIKMLLQTHRSNVYKAKPGPTINIDASTTATTNEQKIYIGNSSLKRDEVVKRIRERLAEIEVAKPKNIAAEPSDQSKALNDRTIDAL